MYISRMALNSVRRGAVQLIASPYRMHSAVEHSFPPADQDEEGRILWRLDAREDGPSIWLYVVSPRRPDFTHINEQAGWPSTGTWETKDYGPVINHLEVGQRWQFRLKANPTRKVARDQGRRENPRVIGTIQGHVTVEQQMDWLLSRCEERGFRVVRDGKGSPLLQVSGRERQTFRHGSSGRVTLVTCVFDGALEVIDPQAFRRTLCYGMGRAKGFGCGLLTVAPFGNITL